MVLGSPHLRWALVSQGTGRGFSSAPGWLHMCYPQGRSCFLIWLPPALVLGCREALGLRPISSSPSMLGRMAKVGSMCEVRRAQVPFHGSYFTGLVPCPRQDSHARVDGPSLQHGPLGSTAVLRTRSSGFPRAGMAGPEQQKRFQGPRWEGDPEVTAEHGMALASFLGRRPWGTGEASAPKAHSLFARHPALTHTSGRR